MGKLTEQETKIMRQGGFLVEGDAAALADPTIGHRLTQVLVKTGKARFVCAIQDVDHLSKAIAAGGDYIRDVALVSSVLDRWQSRAMGAPALPVCPGDPVIGEGGSI